MNILRDLYVPFRTEDEIESIAEEFLWAHQPEVLTSSAILPTDIELIVERSLGLDIIPFSGYRNHLRLDGSISTDLTSITVDEYVFTHVLNRLRFTLAHEVGHLRLHSDVIEALRPRTCVQWCDQQLSLPESLRQRMEIQASHFAGCTLVPAKNLRKAYDEADASLRSSYYSSSDRNSHVLADRIAQQFLVSSDVAKIRLRMLECAV